MKILVVEDARLMALVLQRHLHRLGHPEVTIVESAEEALDHLHYRDVNLLILDWSLPGISGLDLVEQLRSKEKYRRLPIIMVTGHSERDGVIRALHAGVDEYVVKPVHFEVLEEKINRLVVVERRTHQTEIFIRQAEPDDAQAIAALICELAEYERLAHEAAPDVAQLRSHLAAEAHPRCEALLAEDTAGGQVIGFALYFHNYSTFLTRWGIYLEDLYVKPAFRGRGAGFLLFQRVAAVAVERSCDRLDFSVLTWNELALEFYHKIGARALSEWQGMRVEGEALQQLSGSV